VEAEGGVGEDRSLGDVLWLRLIGSVLWTGLTNLRLAMSKVHSLGLFSGELCSVWEAVEPMHESMHR